MAQTGRNARVGIALLLVIGAMVAVTAAFALVGGEPDRSDGGTFGRLEESFANFSPPSSATLMAEGREGLGAPYLGENATVVRIYASAKSPVETCRELEAALGKWGQVLAPGDLPVGAPVCIVSGSIRSDESADAFRGLVYGASDYRQSSQHGVSWEIPEGSTWFSVLQVEAIADQD